MISRIDQKGKQIFTTYDGECFPASIRQKLAPGYQPGKSVKNATNVLGFFYARNHPEHTKKLNKRNQ